ncbi:transposase [Sandaracinomonas limnophila]|uniref:Transposase n=1 Tax=Sandaracinomonas limnophila TaxID=1862386 RepID=A0A437PMP8_9BACT|nr:transposase [Sandaracinomonas limnophila]RVU23354.1 transposase [Sandaracinomonas limnophila]
MSEFRKTHEGYLYFITLTVSGWVDVFSRREYAEIIIENLKYCQVNKGLEIYAYVIMTNHLHLIVSRDKGKIGDWVRDFKSFTSKELTRLIKKNPQESRKDWIQMVFKFNAKLRNKEFGFSFWQDGFYPVCLDSNAKIDQKLDYIHINPVKAGFVSNSEDWRLSSAHIESPIKVLEF